MSVTTVKHEPAKPNCPPRMDATMRSEDKQRTWNLLVLYVVFLYGQVKDAIVFLVQIMPFLKDSLSADEFIANCEVQDFLV